METVRKQPREEKRAKTRSWAAWEQLKWMERCKIAYTKVHKYHFLNHTIKLKKKDQDCARKISENSSGNRLKKKNCHTAVKILLKRINLSLFPQQKGCSRFLRVTAGFEPSAVPSERAGGEGNTEDETELLLQYKG